MRRALGQVGGLACALLLASGCVIAPSIPGGPLQGTSLQGELAAAVSYAPGTVREDFLDGTRRRTTAAGWAGGPMLTRAGARVGITDFFDLAGDYSLSDYGAEVRGGVPEGSPLPWALSFAHRSGKGGVLGGHDDHREWRLRGELYPYMGGDGLARHHLLVAFGGSIGNRVQTIDADPPDFWMLRRETRLEGAFGYEFRKRTGVLAVVALPYWVVEHGPTYDLEGQSDLELSRAFGIAVFFKAGFAFSLYGVDQEPQRIELARRQSE